MGSAYQPVSDGSADFSRSLAVPVSDILTACFTGNMVIA
jgi:hypothetical protein